MRRVVLNLVVPFIVLTIALSFVAVLPATGQSTGTIVSKLDKLRGMLENEHPSLGNKVNAVIHQIEAGSFNGALNKLQNDVKKSIEANVENPQQPIELVNDIIKDIEDLLYPEPPHPDLEIFADPVSLDVVQGDSNSSIISVMSLNNFSQEVGLLNSTTASGVTLSLKPSSVTPPANGTATSTLNATAASDAPLGDYLITVTATSTGFQPKTVSIDLKILASTPQSDKTPPTISSVSRTPETPAYNESVSVEASVFDEGGSGLKQVSLNYSGGSTWIPLVMTLSEGFFKATIPTFQFNTTVEYRVFAIDNNDNVASSILFSYKVIDPYPPMLRIDEPAQGSYLSGTVTITVFMKDQNTGGESGFGRAELSINGTIVKTWLPPAPSMPDTYEWDTATFRVDGLYILKLTVRDKSGNVKEAFINVTVDNTPPSIGTPIWSPKEPAADDDIQVNVTVYESPVESGVDKVNLWYKNTTMNDWQFITMELKDGNWTAILKNQSDTRVAFYIEAFDKAGNRAETTVRFEFSVAAPTGFPLMWILAAIAIILIALVTAIYLLDRRRKKETTTPSVSPPHKIALISPSPPTPTSTYHQRKNQ